MNHIPAPRSRTEKGLQYERWIKSVREQLSGMSAEAQAKAAKANVDFCRGLASPRYSASYQGEIAKAVAPGAVHVDTLLATMSVMYKNDDYIGVQLMPYVPVTKRSDKYAVYPKRERFAFPDDLIGHRSSPNELEATRTTDNYSVEDYGFKNYLDLETVQNQDAPLNEMLDLVESINEGIAFREEKRILAIVVNSSNYAGNTATAGTNWNDSTGGTFISDMLAATSGLYTGQTPTRKLGFCTLTVWNTGVANNPVVRDLFKYNQSGMATTSQIAGYFGLDDILVSRSREDTANSGQTASYARMATTDIFGVLAVAQRPTLRSLHFGSTMRMAGDPYTTQWSDPGVGKRGGVWARVSVSEDHKVVAGDAGFLLTSLLT